MENLRGHISLKAIYEGNIMNGINASINTELFSIEIYLGKK